MQDRNELPTPEQCAAWGRWAASQRTIVRRNCLHCGQPSRGLATRQYCSQSCRQKTKRVRDRAQARR